MHTPEDSTTISLRVSRTLLGRIDAAARRDGVTRNTYVLSWLPDSYAALSPKGACDTETAPTAQAGRGRLRTGHADHSRVRVDTAGNAWPHG